MVQTICQIKTKVHCLQLSTGRSSLTHKHITIFWHIWSRPSTSGSKDLKSCLDRFSGVLLRTAAHTHRTLRAYHTKTEYTLDLRHYMSEFFFFFFWDSLFGDFKFNHTWFGVNPNTITIQMVDKWKSSVTSQTM